VWAAFRAKETMEPLKLQVRACLSLMLGLLPPKLIMRLRRLHRASEPHSARRWVYTKILGVLRHRHLDPKAQSIRIDELDLSLYNDNSILTKRLFYLGQYEGTETYWWKYFCERARDIVEFGANTGLYSIVGARVPGVARYTAIEAHPRCAQVLRQNLKLNGLTNVTVVEAAAIGKAGPAMMELRIPLLDADMTPAGGSLVFHQDPHSRPRETILVRTVEARQYFEHAELIKMDIEGGELSILEAAQDILAHRKPTIFVELLPENVGLGEFIPELCQRCGYQTFAITEDGLQPLAAKELSQVDQYRQFGTRDLILTTYSELPAEMVLPPL
jgi:FkbM family methyltransferase